MNIYTIIYLLKVKGVYILVDAIWALVMTIPTKKNKEINNKFRKLRKHQWFEQKYGSLLTLNSTIRDFIYNYDINGMLQDEKKITKFKDELDALMKKERL